MREGVQICVKCHSADIHTAWMDALPPEVYSRGYQGCRNREEHLHRACRGCGYQWDGPTMDARGTPGSGT